MRFSWPLMANSFETASAAALVADLAELLLVGEWDAAHRARHRTAAEPAPRRSVDIVKRLGRIDEAVP